MNASRPSRPTTMYDACGYHGMPSAGVCVLIARRCVCASRRATTTSIGSNRASIHGAISHDAARRRRRPGTAATRRSPASTSCRTSAACTRRCRPDAARTASTAGCRTRRCGTRARSVVRPQAGMCSRAKMSEVARAGQGCSGQATSTGKPPASSAWTISSAWARSRVSTETSRRTLLSATPGKVAAVLDVDDVGVQPTDDLRDRREHAGPVGQLDAQPHEPSGTRQRAQEHRTRACGRRCCRRSARPRRSGRGTAPGTRAARPVRPRPRLRASSSRSRRRARSPLRCAVPTRRRCRRRARRRCARVSTPGSVTAMPSAIVGPPVGGA